MPVDKFLFVRVAVDCEEHWGSPISPHQCPPLRAAGSECLGNKRKDPVGLFPSLGGVWLKILLAVMETPAHNASFSSRI